MKIEKTEIPKWKVYLFEQECENFVEEIQKIRDSKHGFLWVSFPTVSKLHSLIKER